MMQKNFFILLCLTISIHSYAEGNIQKTKNSTPAYRSYGGRNGNKVFQEQKIKITKKIANDFNSSKIKDFSYYKNILRTLGLERKKIAEITRSTDAKDFGEIRFQGDINYCNLYATPVLAERYRGWEKDIRKLLKPLWASLILQQNRTSKKTFKHTNVDSFSRVMATIKTSKNPEQSRLPYKLTLTWEAKIHEQWHKLTSYKMMLFSRPKPGPKNLNDLFLRAFAHHESCAAWSDLYHYSYTLWKEILNWKKSDGTEDLKKRFAYYHWIMAHWMPFKRGSAAITEWMIQSMGRHHGFSLSFSKEWQSQDQKALTMLLEDFVEGYRKNLILQATPEMG